MLGIGLAGQVALENQHGGRKGDMAEAKAKAVQAEIRERRSEPCADNIMCWWCLVRCCPCPQDVGKCKDDEYKSNKRMTWAGVLVAVTIWAIFALPASVTCSQNDNAVEPCKNIDVEGFPGEEAGKDGDKYQQLSGEKDDSHGRKSYMRKKSFKGFGDDYKKETDVKVAQFLWFAPCKSGASNEESGCWWIGPDLHKTGKATARVYSNAKMPQLIAFKGNGLADDAPTPDETELKNFGIWQWKLSTDDESCQDDQPGVDAKAECNWGGTSKQFDENITTHCKACRNFEWIGYLAAVFAFFATVYGSKSLGIQEYLMACLAIPYCCCPSRSSAEYT